MNREQTTIRLPKEMLESLKQEAYKRGESLNGLLMIIINAGLELIRQGKL